MSGSKEAYEAHVAALAPQPQAIDESLLSTQVGVTPPPSRPDDEPLEPDVPVGEPETPVEPPGEPVAPPTPEAPVETPVEAPSGEQ